MALISDLVTRKEKGRYAISAAKKLIQANNIKRPKSHWNSVAKTDRDIHEKVRKAMDETMTHRLLRNRNWRHIS